MSWTVTRQDRIICREYSIFAFVSLCSAGNEELAQIEREFLLWVQKMYGYIASYNKEYVIESFRKMRMKRWLPTAFVSNWKSREGSRSHWLCAEACDVDRELGPDVP